MTTISVQPAAAGVVDITGLRPGECLDDTLTETWQSHVAAHLERCGAVTGPLASWVCREGHPLYQ